jgi:hypothetical protein
MIWRFHGQGDRNASCERVFLTGSLWRGRSLALHRGQHSAILLGDEILTCPPSVVGSRREQVHLPAGRQGMTSGTIQS